MNFLQRQLPVILAFVFGIGLWAQYYIPSHASNKALEEFNASWSISIAAAALMLGVLSAIHYHSSKVRLKKPGYGYSVVTLSMFAISAFFSLIMPAIMQLLSVISGGKIDIAKVAHFSWTKDPIGDASPFMWIFNNMHVPLDATMFSLLCFFIASAAFRAFRARSFEATALLIAGCVVMLGRVPLGEQIQLYAGHWNLSDLSQWLLNYPSTGAQRGILLGIYMSQVAISLRIIFGIERTYMGGGD